MNIVYFKRNKVSKMNTKLLFDILMDSILPNIPHLRNLGNG